MEGTTATTLYLQEEEIKPATHPKSPESPEELIEGICLLRLIESCGIIRLIVAVPI